MRDNGLTTSDLARAEQLLAQEDHFVRSNVMAVLEYAQPEARSEAIALAERSLHDPEWLVRMGALRALNKLDPEKARPIAQAWVNDPEPFIREMAKKVLDPDYVPQM